MHYQVSSIKNPESIISKLAEKCPWFSDSIDLDEGPYSVLGDFAIYLRDNIVDEEELNDAFDFLNQMGASDDTEIQNQLVVGVLEILADTDSSVLVAKKRLIGRSLELFNRTLSGWNNT